MCSKPNHFASVCFQKNKPAREKTAHKGHKRVQQVTEEADESEEEENDGEDLLFKIEEVSSVKTSGKQFNTKITFSDQEELYFTELQCKLDTGARAM